MNNETINALFVFLTNNAFTLFVKIIVIIIIDCNVKISLYFDSSVLNFKKIKKKKKGFYC